MCILPRPEIHDLPPVHHGAPDYGELEAAGVSADQIIDFSSNCNPFGPAPGVLKAISRIPLDRYPDRDGLALRRALAAHHDIQIENILAANGTSELIWLIALAYINPGERALVLGPTFGEYAHAAKIMGARVDEICALPEDDFAWDARQISKLSNYKLIFICNPNNPTGQILPFEEINHWIDENPQTLFILDEAYAAFASNHHSAINNLKSNIVVLRSMTKDYALAGLRLGYAVAHPGVIRALKKVQPPWSVNALAQAAGLAALKEQDYLHACLEQLELQKEYLVVELQQLGYEPLHSKTHFFLLPVKDGAAFRSALFARGIQVRDCASFGLPAYVRIATRKEHENKLLINAIKGIHREDTTPR